jgi:hypothetical protein
MSCEEVAPCELRLAYLKVTVSITREDISVVYSHYTGVVSRSYLLTFDVSIGVEGRRSSTHVNEDDD